VNIIDTDLQLFERMLRIRRIEENIASVYSEQEMRCPVHLCIGQEAVAVGVCAHLTIEDWAFGGHRAHGHYLAKGGDLRAMLAEMYGKSDGCCGGRGGSMHLIDLKVGFLGATPIVGSTIPIAVGAAFASMLRHEPRVVAVFFGEGAAEEGVFHEALNYATLKNLPVLFVCENNQYSVYSPLSVRQSASRTVCDIARGHGLSATRADGNDLRIVTEVAATAIDKIRMGGGPALLEFDTYRWREHCGPNYDNHIGYRNESEFQMWLARCPISRFATVAGIGERQVEDIEKRLAAEWQDAIRFAKASPFPSPTTLLDNVYPPIRA
jgi:TPP-dependent pyruvate/acetoin dehydrogenase alpha subunit